MKITRDIYKKCELCPRRCLADRTGCEAPGSGPGYCRMGEKAVLARAMLHPWEEPGITKNGAPSGAVFFTGCTMQCVYCQNRMISGTSSGTAPAGLVRTPEQMAEIFLRLQRDGACNIDLVTPTHFVPDIIEALEIAGDRLRIPVVYNTGGYERPEVIRAVGPYVSYWLPDIKYYDDAPAVKYSAAPRYFETATGALSEMIRAAGGKKDHVIARHMVLPGQKEDSIRILHTLAERFGTDSFLLSLMSQYTPPREFSCSRESGPGRYPELSRRVTTYEYEKVVEEALKLGFDGYRQDRTTAKEEYTPDFDLSGL